jgi:hypothetical protein
MAFLASILGRPAFFFLLLRIDDDSNVMILSHTTSGMQYEESTPVTSDINTAQKKV